MIVWYSLEIGCPVCSYRSKIRELGGGFAVGQDSDLLVRMEGKHLIQAAIHTCLRCRYSGYAEDFTLTLRKSVAERFLAEVSPKLRKCEFLIPHPDLQYYWSYLCLALRSRSDRELGMRLLRAYWCLRLPPSRDLLPQEVDRRSKRYLTGAIHHLCRDSQEMRSPVQTYLIAELSRRNGEFPAAVGHFKRFLEMARGPGPVPAYLRLAARKLLRTAEQGDRRSRTMEEIVYADSPE